MSQSDIQLRLYKAILIAAASLSVVSIIGNQIANFPFQPTIKWIVLFCVVTVAYIFSNNRKYTPHIMFGVFFFLIFFFLPFAFADSGGSNNNSMGYIFLLLIAITYLFRAWRRFFLTGSLITVFIGMHAAEYYYPEWITVYSDWNQFIDRMLQMPLLLMAGFLIILRFAKEYERVNRELESFAHFDELTGLHNRRMFNKAAAEAANIDDGDAHLVLLDLDNFKMINDRYGHHVGDEVLKELSGLLQTAFGTEKNIVSRWGGDEFAVIFYGDREELANRLDDVNAAFQKYISGYEGNLGISTSTVAFRDYEKVSQALIVADQGLYEEKLSKIS